MTQMPLVSVCTPTFNRRPFIPAMLQCFAHQTYPRDRMEWVIIDDFEITKLDVQRMQRYLNKCTYPSDMAQDDDLDAALA